MLSQAARGFLAGFAFLACTAPTGASAPAAAGASDTPPPAAPTQELALTSETPPPSPSPPTAAVAPPPDTKWTSLPPVTGCSRSATVLLIDRSGSMTGVPLDMAKTAASDALAKLDARDCFGVIAFDSLPTRVVPIAPVVDRAAMTASIAKIMAGGGTDIFSPLQAGAKDILVVSGAKHRSVLLLTDGQAAQNGVRELASTMARDGVVISTIGLGSGVDESFLRMISEQGNGRTTLVRDPSALPKAVVRETSLLAGMAAPK